MFVEAWIYSVRDTIWLCPVFKDQINNVHLVALPGCSGQ